MCGMHIVSMYVVVCAPILSFQRHFLVALPSMPSDVYSLLPPWRQAFHVEHYVVQLQSLKMHACMSASLSLFLYNITLCMHACLLLCLYRLCVCVCVCVCLVCVCACESVWVSVCVCIRM